ncbi:hypothetical protein B0H34DRAFT_787178 [Crassisporium funariophilum]|nr:hypothetical protein B0H34DRAFT_787178 [Crassisporium funariophilum]
MWKRFAIAVGCGDVPRIRSLVAAELRHGSGVSAIVEKVEAAALRAYRPLGYVQTEYKLAYLLYQMGGRLIANVAHQALGLPSIDTVKRHRSTAPLQSSAGFPTHEELNANLSICYPSDDARDTSCSGVIEGAQMPVDELKISERLRWDPRTNMILGVCREHGKQTALEYRSQFQADTLLKCLKNKTVHLATEATVIGCSIFSSDSRKNVTKPFVVSGTCKRETVHNQTMLLRRASSTLNAKLRSMNCRLYCLSSDGDAHRRQSFITLTLDRDHLESSPIHPLLTSLPLFNLKCGEEDITPDFDCKHVLKRFRNTLLCQKGVVINGISLNTSIIKAHLVENGMASSTADTLLTPNNKQDVVLMMKLLHSITLLKPSLESDKPTSKSTRRVLRRLLGKLYRHLLQAYTDVSLSLSKQLVHLSAASHLILAIYNQEKGEFIPVQTCFDTAAMIKNVYFCVAQVQKDNPDGSFWIVLIGLDGLEKVFGKVRTMVSNDTNADQYQLTNHIDGAVQCVNILEEHPEWALPDDINEVSSKYDHISPKSWRGDVSVKNVVLSGCWMEGRRMAEEDLCEAGITPPMLKVDGWRLSTLSYDVQ